MEKSIFNHWDTFPVIFLTKEQLFNQPWVKSKSEPMVRGKVYPFYLTPKRVNDQSMIKTLKKKFGVMVGGVKSFTTPHISTSKVTHYNGFQFYLSLENERVYLKVISDNKLSSEVFWNIEDISNSMKQKNPTYKVITPSFMKELISNGWLQVKFNVSKTKDHGTLWRVFINDEKEVKPKKTGKPVVTYIKENKIDKVLCWELSRIGRNTIEVLKTIKLLNDNCISLYIKNYNIETLNDKCEINPLSQFMIQIDYFGLY